MKPQWTDAGRPANLAAATMDALLWLQLFQAVLEKHPTLLLARPEENKARLSMCIASIQELLEEEA